MIEVAEHGHAEPRPWHMRLVLAFASFCSAFAFFGAGAA